MLNDPLAQSEGRQPRALVQLNGITVPGWVSWEVENNSFYEADSFRVSFAVSALPTAMNANWFSTQTETFFEVFAGFPADPNNPIPQELLSLVYGRADHIEYNPVSTLITVSGRDLTAPFIDNKITQDYANQKSSQIATTLATTRGLTPKVTATTEIIGTYYKHDEVRLQAGRSEWDLLAWLAREEGFVCYVSGKTLFFGPDPRSTDNPYVIQWSSTAQGNPLSNVIDLNFSRDQTVAKGVSVVVRSPSLTKKTAVVKSYPTSSRAINPGESSPFGKVQTYYFTITANQTPVQCEQYAEQKYNEIVSHAMKMSAHLPGDNLLLISTPIKVTGTGTGFDQIYYPRNIMRSMNFDEGYRMNVEAQNSSPDLEQS